MSEILTRNEPLYIKLKHKLMAYIERENPVLLPTERELMEYYGVSRKTVRNAVGELIRDGLVEPVRGKGTVVTRRPVQGHDVLILLDNLEHIPLYEYEIYSEVQRQLAARGIHPVVQLIDPHSEQLPAMLGNISGSARKILCFSSICNRKDIFESFNTRRDSILVAGFKPLYDYNQIYSDIYGGCKKITQYLISQGHREIAFTGLQRDTERFPAFKAALNEAGISLNETLLCDASGTRHDGYRATMELLNSGKNFSALLTHNDLSALGAMEALATQGIKVPQQLSLAGCDNISDSKHFPVPLTTAGHSHDLYAEVIIDFLNSTTTDKIKHKIPMKLIIRESVKKYQEKLNSNENG